MLVNIIETFDEGGLRWFAGDNPDVARDVAARWIADGKATADADGAQDQRLTAAQVQAVQALIDGSGVDVAFLREHDGAAAGYTLDAGSGNVLPVMRVTVEAATDIIAGQRISAGGANTFETTITGASAEGEVIPIGVGAGRVTRVHIGSSLGASQTLDADGAVTVNELGRWSCLETDDCNAVYVRFSAPRGSGRYCDVSIVGKRRA